VPGIEISFDLSRIDFRATSDHLMQSYWGTSRTDEANRRAFGNSLCVGAYLDGEQVGFARAITDYTVFAYLADVIVWPERRGHGIGKQLVQALLDNPEMTAVSHWSLTTSDAQSLYQKFGFRTEGRYMRLDRSPAA
jgi:GNAT superfamily N-acetyltransferase